MDESIVCHWTLWKRWCNNELDRQEPLEYYWKALVYHLHFVCVSFVRNERTCHDTKKKLELPVFIVKLVIRRRITDVLPLKYIDEYLKLNRERKRKRFEMVSERENFDRFQCTLIVRSLPTRLIGFGSINSRPTAGVSLLPWLPRDQLSSFLIQREKLRACVCCAYH